MTHSASAVLRRIRQTRVAAAGLAFGGLLAAFAAGFLVARADQSAMGDVGGAPVAWSSDACSAREDVSVIGLRVYSEGGRPVGRVAALLRSDAHEDYALIAPDEPVAGSNEIAVPISRLLLQGGQIVLSAVRTDEAPRRLRI